MTATALVPGPAARHGAAAPASSTCRPGPLPQLGHRRVPAPGIRDRAAGRGVYADARSAGRGTIVSDAGPDQTLPAAEREWRWDVSLRLAIEAASAAEAQAITSQVLSRMRRELPLQGEPVITPLPARDGLWDAGP
jgi:hypothetical protein